VAKSEQDATDLTQAFVDALRRLTVDDLPSLEYLFIGQLVDTIVDIDHGGAATDDDAAKVLAVFQSVLMVCRDTELKPPAVPLATKDITECRMALVEGAHSFAAHGPDGVQALVARLFPAVMGELDQGDDLDARLQGVYEWVLMGVLSGFDSDHPELWATAGIVEALAQWSEIMVPET
jgi:hypothetical protein